MTQATALPRASLGELSRNLVFLTVRKHFLRFSLNFPFLKFILFTPILRPHLGQPPLLSAQTLSGLCSSECSCESSFAAAPVHVG